MFSSIARQKCFIFLCGAAVLMLGVFTYLLIRDPASLYISKFIPVLNKLQSNASPPKWIVIVTNSFPTFSHAFSFSIYTALTIDQTRKNILISCVFWCATGSFFEIIQASNLPFCNANQINLLCKYIESGVFDWTDLFSIIIGSTMAYLLLTTQTEMVKK